MGLESEQVVTSPENLALEHWFLNKHLFFGMESPHPCFGVMVNKSLSNK
jgi:hypothetical protein